MGLKERELDGITPAMKEAGAAILNNYFEESVLVRGMIEEEIASEIYSAMRERAHGK